MVAAEVAEKVANSPARKPKTRMTRAPQTSPCNRGQPQLTSLGFRVHGVRFRVKGLGA